MSSWKSYGGINSYENINNIAVDHLSVNYLTLNNDYVGYFSICGELSVSDDTYLRSNVSVNGNHVTFRESTVNGNSFNKKNVDIRGNLGVGKNVDISGDTLMWGNLLLMKNYELEGNLTVNGNSIQMGLVSRNPGVYNINLSSVEKKLGLNNSTPTHTFDIKTDQIDGFSIKSIKTTNKNVIAQNNTGCGIVVKTDISNSSLDFFNDNSIQNGVSDASITYSIGGNLVVKSSNNTLINSKVSISNRNVGNHSSHNETAVIYDISSGKYLYDIYENTVFSTGSALTLISDSSYSSTGLNIMTPSGKGIKIVGGTEITDKNRTSGVIGILDESNNIVPSLSIISGNSRVRNRSSIGINKCLPGVDDIVLDVNGKVKICQSEIVMVSNKQYEIKKIVFSKTKKLNGFAFGSPVSSTANNLIYTYKQVLLYTNDGGANWAETVFTSQLSASKSTVLKTGCTSGDNVGFVAGENSLILFSTDAFKTWTILTYSLPPGTVLDITNINIDTEITTHTLYIFHISTAITLTNKQQIGYFTFSSLGNAYLLSPTTPLSSPHPFISYPYSFGLGLPNFLQTNASFIDPPYVLIAGERGIGRFQKIGNTLSLSSSYNGNHKYNSISQFGNTVIAVGNIISVSNNRGGIWTDFTTNAVLNDVYVNSLTTAVAVGNNGAFYSTTNSGVSWNTNVGTINNSGVGNLILNPSRNLSSINMVDDNNTFIISSTVIPYSISGNVPQYAESKIYNCYFPEIFDNTNNNVLDVCGNMRLSGDTTVYGNAYVSKNMTANKVKTEFIDYVNSNISIGTLSGGKTIRISDATTATSGNPNNIFIGGINDNVVIEGATVSVIGTIATRQATIQLLKNNTGGTGATGTSAGAGVNIRDFNDDTSAYIHVNQQLDGFVLKSSKIHPNILNIRTNDLTIANRTDIINNRRIRNGIVILRDSSAVYNDPTIASNITTMTTAWFDASSVLLHDYTFTGESANQQTVTTDFGVSGDVIFYNDLRVNNDAYLNNMLYVNYLDVKYDSILRGPVELSDTTENSLNVMGGGNFSGNLNLSGNLNMEGSAIIAGNLHQKARTFLTGNYDAYDLLSGALQITGGVSTKGNIFIGNNLNVTGNSTFKKIVNITNTTDSTDYLSGSFIVDGGASIKKNVFIMGNLEIKNNLRVKDVTDASGINIASVILSGGCVISKQLYCEGNLITNGNLSVYNDVIVGTRNLYPIIPLSVSTPFTSTSITTVGQTITGGNYMISAGPSLNSLYFNSFNTTGTDFWSGSGYVSTGFPDMLSGNLPTTRIDGVNVSGNFLQIKLPSRVIMTSYLLESVSGRQPTSWFVCGSNDGINFTSLDARTDVTFLIPTTFNRKLSVCNKSFTFHRLVVTKMVSNGNGSVFVSKFYLNGFPEKEVDTSIISIGSTSVMGNVVISGSSKVNDETDSINQVSGAFIVSGGIGVSGNSFLGDVNLKNGNVTNNLIVNKFVGIGGVLSSSYTLDVSGSTNIRGTLNVNGSIGVSGQFTVANIIFTDRTDTTQLGTGALILLGGASIAGNLFTGGNIVSNSNLTVSGNTNVNGTLHSNIRSNNIVIESGGNLTVASGGNFTVASGGNFICLGTFNLAQSVLTSDIQSNDTISGSLVIKGGAGISANVNIGGNLKVNGCTILKTFTCSENSLTNGIAFYGNTIDSVKLSSGALQVSGGSSIMGNIYVGGNIILSGQILVRPNISSNSIGEGSLIVVGGASISENCNIGGNTMIFGSTNNISTIFFPATASVPPPPTTLPMPTVSTVSVKTNGATALNEQTSVTVFGQTYIDSYQNGTYYITTGYPALNDVSIQRTYYGHYAVIRGYNIPWISTRTYLNTTGRTTSVPLVDTFITDYTTDTTFSRGDWIQYSLPYSLTLISYDLTFNEVVSSVSVGRVIESYPTSWIIAGSNDGVTWMLITEIFNHFSNLDVNLPSNVINKNFPVSGSVIGYRHIRFIIRKTTLLGTDPATGGTNVPGLYNITFNGIPSISPITPSVTSTINSNVTVNPITNKITYNTPSSSNINALVGAGTFAGKSSLVVFGDSTIYGKHNVLNDINIIGNINNPNILNINSNTVNLSGNMTAKSIGILNMSCTKLVVVDISSNSIFSNNLDSIDISSTRLFSTDISSTRLFSTDISSTRLFSTDISSNKLFSTDISSTRLFSTDISSTRLFSRDISSNKLFSTDISSTRLFSTDISSTRLFSTDISSTRLFSTDISSNKLFSIDISSTRLYSRDISSNKLFSTDISSTRLYSRDISSNKLFSTDISCNNLRSFGTINGAVGTFDSMSLGTLNSSGLITCTDINSTGIITGLTGNFDDIFVSDINCDNLTSFGTINGAVGIFDSMTLGTLNSSGPINSAGIITGPRGVFSTLLASDISCNNMKSTGILNGEYSTWVDVNSRLIQVDTLNCYRGLNGNTGSFYNMFADRIQCPDTLTGNKGAFNSLSVNGLSGNTGSFYNLYSDNITCPGTLNGHTGTFDYCNIGSGALNSLSVNNLAGNAGSFYNLYVDNITCPGTLNGHTGTFDYCNVGQLVTNNIRCTNNVTATTFTTTSDYRIKGNVRTLDSSFSVDNLRPVSYVNELTNNQDIGLIAHELQEEYPFLVCGEKDGIEKQSVNYTGIIGILINEIKSLKKRVSILEGL